MSKENNPQSPFPSDFVQRSHKTKPSWILQAVKAAHDYANTNVVGSVTTERQKFLELDRYASGDYDVSKFKDLVSGKGNTTQANLNLKVATPIPTIVENLVGQLENIPIRPKVTCTSGEGKTQEDKKLKELKVSKLLKSKEEELGKLGINVDEKLSGKVVFQDDQEIELYMETSFKDDFTASMQAVIDYVLKSQRFPEIRRKIIRDVVVFNKLCLKVSYNSNYDIVIRRVDPKRHISDFAKNDDYSDTKYQGEYISLTLDQVAADANPSELNEDALKSIAKQVASSYGNGGWNNEWDARTFPDSGVLTRPWGKFRVNVLDLEYMSNNSYQYELKEKGTKVFFDELKGKPKNPQKVTEKRLTDKYKAKWIIGTDYMYDYGLCDNQLRRQKLDGSFSGETYFSFVTFQSDMRDMRNTSIVERLIGLADAYVLVNLKAQTLVAKARAQAVKIDVSVLGAITNALGMKNIKPKELINAMEQSSVYYVSSTTEKGTILPHTQGITEIPESRLTGLAALAGHEQGILRAMEFATGVPLSTIGAPDSESLVGLQKAAAENRNNSIRFLVNAYKSVLSRTCDMIVIMAQDSISGGAKKLDDYQDSIGVHNANMLQMTEKLTAARFGIFIEMLPTAEEQQEFMISVNKSVELGKLKRSQAMRVLRISRESLNSAERVMALMEKQNKKEELETSAAQSQAQSEAAAQAAMMAEQAKQQTLELEWDLKSQYLQLEYQLKERLSAVDHKEKVNEQLVDGDVKEELIEKAAEVQEQQLKETEKGEAMAGSMPAIMGGQPNVGTAAGTSNMTAPSRQ
jgi:hypothetical protein